jgi:hypothetical protein
VFLCITSLFSLPPFSTPSNLPTPQPSLNKPPFVAGWLPGICNIQLRWAGNASTGSLKLALSQSLEPSLPQWVYAPGPFCCCTPCRPVLQLCMFVCSALLEPNSPPGVRAGEQRGHASCARQ